MIILIGGESHTGKTLMAQNLLEKYKYPYTSLDHLKMGLVRGYKNCEFTPLDSDEYISDKMWGFVDGIINTCLENNQHIILEGCYLPPDRVNSIISDKVIAIYIVFSEEYIDKNFDKILDYENIIEKRITTFEVNKEEFKLDNYNLKNKCISNGIPYFEIKNDYIEEIKQVYNFIQNKMVKLREYNSNDLNQICYLFYNTVHSVCSNDYTQKQLNAWADGNINKELWDESLSDHYSIVAELEGEIVGFGDLDDDYFDRLYVHKDYQGQGIATSILMKLEACAKKNNFDSITTYASITAKPFFEKFGYKFVEENKVERNGEVLTNFLMKKSI